MSYELGKQRAESIGQKVEFFELLVMSCELNIEH
jgi:hypothetical protein